MPRNVGVRLLCSADQQMCLHLASEECVEEGVGDGRLWTHGGHRRARPVTLLYSAGTSLLARLRLKSAPFGPLKLRKRLTFLVQSAQTPQIWVESRTGAVAWAMRQRPV